jgi:iron complex transport system permease protein
MVFFLSRGAALGSAGLYGAAFLGSMLVMGLVLLVSSRVRQMPLLVVCGVMIGYICSAVTDLVVTFADDANIVNLRAWSLGSFSGISWANVRMIALVVGVGTACSFLLSKPMHAYQLGEAYARSAGVRLRPFRLELILLSSVLSACVTAYAGPVSFVGVAAPHLMKSLFGTAKPVLMVPACFLGGAVFCLGCDLIARTLFAPTELAIGSVTAVFGAPVVIWMLVTRRREAGA